MSATRRRFMGSLSGVAGVSALAGQQRKAASLPKARISPLDGITRENIKITDIGMLSLGYRLKPDEEWPDGANNGIIWKAESVIVEVSTDSGLKGIGGCSRYNVPAAMKAYLEKVVKPVILGKNPFDVEALSGGITGPGARGVWAGVDVALWDIIGKAKGLPLCKLLATDTEPKTRVRAYASGGEFSWRKGSQIPGPEDLIKQALRHKAAGFTAFKFRPGGGFETIRQHPGVHPLPARTEEGGRTGFRLDSGIQHALVGGSVPGDRSGSGGTQVPVVGGAHQEDHRRLSHD